jgi:hypothetical protein
MSKWMDQARRPGEVARQPSPRRASARATPRQAVEEGSVWMARQSARRRAVQVTGAGDDGVWYRVLRGSGAGAQRVMAKSSFLSTYRPATVEQEAELEREAEQARVARDLERARPAVAPRRRAMAPRTTTEEQRAAKLATVRPGSVWRAAWTTGRAVRVTEVDLDAWTVSYVKVRGTGPAEKTIELSSLINGYRLAEAGRQVTSGERYELRHLLQELSEHARSARNAVEPETGVYGLSTGQWEEQWEQMKAHIDAFTRQVLRRP